MRIVLTILILVLTFTSSKVSAQINLDNVVVVAQQNKTDHRYSLELAIMEVLRKYNVNAISAISVLKDGQGPPSLANDSVQKRLSDNGFNMFMLVSVRGYDKRFLPPSNSYSLNEELKAGHLFPYYEKKRSSVTFTVSFF